MDDNEKQKLVDGVLSRNVNVSELSDDDFIELLDGLKRIYFARAMNCVDATAKRDNEWLALSDVFDRLHKGAGRRDAANGKAAGQ